MATATNCQHQQQSTSKTLELGCPRALHHHHHHHLLLDHWTSGTSFSSARPGPPRARPAGPGPSHLAHPGTLDTTAGRRRRPPALLLPSLPPICWAIAADFPTLFTGHHGHFKPAPRSSSIGRHPHLSQATASNNNKSINQPAHRHSDVEQPIGSTSKSGHGSSLASTLLVKRPGPSSSSPDRTLVRLLTTINWVWVWLGVLGVVGVAGYINGDIGPSIGGWRTAS